MTNITINAHHDRPREFDQMNSHALVSFRAIVAGLLFAMFCMIGLMGLGLAFGGIELNENASARSVGIFTGAWFLGSTLISVFLGSYFAARISKFRTGRVGSAQGIVIAALFLGFFLYQSLSLFGPAGSFSMSGVLSPQGVGRFAASSSFLSVNQITEDALGDLNLKSSPHLVAEGLAQRLVRGDATGAKNYLSTQAGITPTEADARVVQMKGQVDQFLADAREATGTALRSVGWSLFFLVALGAIAGMGGGALGSVVNFRKPLIRELEGQVYREDVHA